MVLKCFDFENLQILWVTISLSLFGRCFVCLTGSVFYTTSIFSRSCGAFLLFLWIQSTIIFTFIIFSFIGSRIIQSFIIYKIIGSIINICYYNDPIVDNFPILLILIKEKNEENISVKCRTDITLHDLLLLYYIKYILYYKLYHIKQGETEISNRQMDTEKVDLHLCWRYSSP